MDSSTASKNSPEGAESLELDLPTSAADVRRLRELRRSFPADLRRLNDLSATRIFPQLRQRRSTSANREPITL
jgi:hypothetical protein